MQIVLPNYFFLSVQSFPPKNGTLKFMFSAKFRLFLKKYMTPWQIKITPWTLERLAPVNIYLFRVNNKNTRKRYENLFKVNNKDTRTTSMTLFWCFYCELLTYFTPFSSVSIVDFEQVSVGWDVSSLIHGDRHQVICIWFNYVIPQNHLMKPKAL